MVKVDPAATGILRLSSGRATTVPFTAVMIGPERTTTDNATTPSTRVGTRAAVGRSVLGPHGIGNRWSSAGANGHRRYARIPRSQPIHIYGMGRWTGEGRVRIPPPAPAFWAELGREHRRLLDR